MNYLMFKINKISFHHFFVAEFVKIDYHLDFKVIPDWTYLEIKFDLLCSDLS